MRVLVLFATLLLAMTLAGAIKAEHRQLNPVSSWLFKLAMRAAPPSHAWKPPSGPHANETVEQRTERYRDIAYDIYRVVYYEPNRPIFGNRLFTAGFLLGMAVGESGLAPDADLGPCYLEGMKGKRCDGGRAVGILQVWIPKGIAYRKADRAKAQEPYWRDRWRLITRGLAEIRGSIGVCHKLPVEERLAAYGAGTCESPVGRRVSRKRWALIRRIMGAVKPPSRKVARELIIKARVE